MKPLDILGKLIPRIEDEFYIPNITIRQTLELLRNCKGSNSTGYDDINSKFIKKMQKENSPSFNPPN